MPSALALTGSSLGSLARLQTSTSRMKGLFLVGAPFWLAHNLMVGAVFALGTDLVSLASNLASLAKFLVRRGASARASNLIPSITEPVSILA
ncbi:YgjV family protein [Novosphingobium sp. NDB2Meth1]|uniref:YgjV family protein n=1 Tax=Novosphingobium sp. NDB2Meth1 TaxID=1892847 RepID=UPI00352A27C5